MKFARNVVGIHSPDRYGQIKMKENKINKKSNTNKSRHKRYSRQLLFMFYFLSL